VWRKKLTANFAVGFAVLNRTAPLSVASFRSQMLQERVRQILDNEKIDLIWVSSAPMAQYVWRVHEIPKIIDFVDVDSEKWRIYAERHAPPLSWVYRLEARRLGRYEEAAARLFDRSLFISLEETVLFRQRICDRPITVLPNGVDTDYFSPMQRNVAFDGQPVIVFTGVMDYFPNVDAVTYFSQEVFPPVRKVIPQAQFYIVGRNPVRRVRELAYPPSITVTGAVPDVRPYLARAAVAVAPFRVARGVQNKVLEAMAMQLPVVGTSVAFEGIPATRNDGVRTANDPETFAREVVELLQGDKELRRQCGRQARRYVEQQHQWDSVGLQIERLVQQTVSTTQPAYKTALL
jgi:sugar transferase (PEP-CTERM/EpsH1 system associated)